MSYATASADRPLPAVPRAADWMVAGVVLLALLVAWLIGAQAVGAAETITTDGVTVSVPAGTIQLQSEQGYVASTPGGLTVRIIRSAAPPVGVDDLGALATNRVLELGRDRTGFLVINTEVTKVADRDATVIEYMYVDEGNGLYSARLQLIRGYEALVGAGDTYYAISLEGPEAQWEEVQRLWPQLLGSLRFA